MAIPASLHLGNQKVGGGPGICVGLSLCHSPACHPAPSAAQSLKCMYPAQVGEPSSKETHISEDLSISANGGIHQSCLLVWVHSYG